MQALMTRTWVCTEPSLASFPTLRCNWRFCSLLVLLLKPLVYSELHVLSLSAVNLLCYSGFWFFQKKWKLSTKTVRSVLRPSQLQPCLCVRKWQMLLFNVFWILVRYFLHFVNPHINRDPRFWLFGASLAFTPTSLGSSMFGKSGMF